MGKVTSASDASVLYADGDYAGLGRRSVILLIDGVVVALAWFVLIFIWSFLYPNDEPDERLIWTGIAFAYVYLAILKASPVRTLGYRLTGVRIVDHQGRRPSYFQMTIRLLSWIVGPINPLIDFFWLGGDRHGQTLRDKFAGTYVIRNDASPVGHGRRQAAYYNILGGILMFWEIHPSQ